MAEDMKRLFVWCVPRTVSTALVKCLSFVEGLQVVLEPYGCAFKSGPERKNPNPDLTDPYEQRLHELRSAPVDDEVRGYEDSVCTYSFVRDELLSASYKDTKILFCKDMAYYLDTKYHMLPRGFRYSFLIRHPAKVYSSGKKSLTKVYGEDFDKEVDLLKLPKTLVPAGYGFKELYELMEYVEKELHQEPVILDTDDLLADPPGILSAYCLKMGIPYKPELLSWEAGVEVTDKWVTSKTLKRSSKKAGFFDNAFNSSGFFSPQPPPALDSLPADVQTCVRASMGYYEKLRTRRIRPLSEV
ncbi:uncharacterized protein [Asterias amurensis]|uniref:uncharacterized protein n=1 Tax=Asterias amurensis TaxID=7602 RepID=UPI003AB9031E